MIHQEDDVCFSYAHKAISSYNTTGGIVALDTWTGLKTIRSLASQQWCYMLWGSVSFSKGLHGEETTSFLALPTMHDISAWPWAQPRNLWCITRTKLC
jgi:hypothetical protein